jgi:ectoine hydroxylase-related dioxygenase (phytanoyl-CoA dioxygenase family)
MTTVIADPLLAHYREYGFAVVRGAVPSAIRSTARALIEPWVDASIETWRRDGRIRADFRDLDFDQRFLAAWRAAGEPHFRRSPNHFLINPGMYDFLRSPELLALAERFVGTPELSVHGIFNARPQLPHHADTMTPWHQDSQYWDLDYGAEFDAERRTHVLTMWMPLVPVDARSGTLQVLSRAETGDVVFAIEHFDFERTGFLGLTRADVAKYTPIAAPMEPGDVLVFNQRTPHGAAPNTLDRVRWSVDIRYEATATATVVGRKYGFVAQSLADPSSETSLEDWLAKRQAPSPFAPQPVA